MDKRFKVMVLLLFSYIGDIGADDVDRPRTTPQASSARQSSGIHPISMISPGFNRV
jgi:hypothetical protein